MVQATEETRPLEQDQSTSNAKIAIIGGGVAGISAARIFKAQGLSFDLYETSNSLSGVWSKGYPNFAIQVPGKLYEFPDKELPAPKDYQDGFAIKKYCEDYATENRLHDCIHLNSKVISINKESENKWMLTVESRGTHFRKAFDFVVLATGIYSPDLKFIPDLKGIQHFRGKTYHSEDTEKIETRKGKKVVVVGYGKSAQDCAMNAYAETGVSPILLLRTAHWCVPRNILGLIPMEWLLYSRFGQGTLPRWQTCGPVEYMIHTVMKPLIWLYWRIVETILTMQLGLWGKSSHLRPFIRV